MADLLLGRTQDNTDVSVATDDLVTRGFIVGMTGSGKTGLGIGLISVLDAEEDIASGKLIAPLGTTVLSNMPEDTVPGFYLITTKTRLRAKPVAALHRWLLEQDWKAIQPDRA